MAEGPLVSLTTLKAAANEPNPSSPSPKDAHYQVSIDAASALIRAYTGLSFELADSAVATTRTYEYDGSGYLDIDETATITGVSVNGGFSWSTTRPLTTDQWSAQPYNKPVKLWLRLPEGGAEYGISPEMGFTYNLDTIGYRLSARPPIISVTAIWGWPSIPTDVQQAAIWTALSIHDTPKAYQQESIEGYSRTRGGADAAEAIPERAQIALMPYIIPRL